MNKIIIEALHPVGSPTRLPSEPTTVLRLVKNGDGHSDITLVNTSVKTLFPTLLDFVLPRGSIRILTLNKTLHEATSSRRGRINFAEQDTDNIVQVPVLNRDRLEIRAKTGQKLRNSQVVGYRITTR